AQHHRHRDRDRHCLPGHARCRPHGDLRAWDVGADDGYPSRPAGLPGRYSSRSVRVREPCKWICGMNAQPMKITDQRDLTTEPFDTFVHLTHARQQAEARNYDEFFIVDVDSHHYENEASTEIASYVRNDVLRNEILYQGISRKGITTGFGQYQDLAGRLTRYSNRKKEQVPETPHRDVTLMRRWMDAMGVDVACM